MRIAILGNGSIGKRHTRNLISLGFKDLICMDPSAEAREQVRELFPNAIQFDSAERVFSEGKPDVVFVCSPPQHHLPQLNMALDNGCHVFVEKPFSHDVNGIAEALKKADEKNLKVMTGFNMRHVGPLKQMKQWVDEGRIGRILSCRIAMSSYMPNWHPWEDYREGFMAFTKSGGGALFDYVHCIDMVQWYAGNIKTLSSVLKTAALEMETDDMAVLIGTTESGVVYDMYFDFLDHTNRRHIEMIGTKGTVIWDLNSQHSLSLYDSETGEKTVREGRFDWDSCYVDLIKTFFDALKNDLPLSSDGWNGLNTQEVLAMALESNAQGKMVSR